MRFFRLMILAALVAPGAVSAQTRIAAGAPQASGGRTVDEVMAMARTRLMAGDIDRDGRLSREEFIAMRTAARGDGQRDPARAFARMDRNGDGYLSADEIDNALVRRIARLDANHDGVITHDERQAGHAGATRN